MEYTHKQRRLLAMAANGTLTAGSAQSVFANRRHASDVIHMLYDSGLIRLCGYGVYGITDEGMEVLVGSS